MRKFSPKGFSIVESLLIIVVVAAVGVATYYLVSHSDEESKDSSSQTTQNSGTVRDLYPSGVPDGWTSYSSEEFGFSVAFPSPLEANVYTAADLTGEGEPTVFSLKDPQVEAKKEFAGDSLRIEALKLGDTVYHDDATAINQALADGVDKLTDVNRAANFGITGSAAPSFVGTLESLPISGGQAAYFEVNGVYHYDFSDKTDSAQSIDEPTIVGFMSNGSNVLFFTYQKSDDLSRQILSTFSFD